MPAYSDVISLIHYSPPPPISWVVPNTCVHALGVFWAPHLLQSRKKEKEETREKLFCYFLFFPCIQTHLLCIYEQFLGLA